MEIIFSSTPEILLWHFSLEKMRKKARQDILQHFHLLYLRYNGHGFNIFSIVREQHKDALSQKVLFGETQPWPCCSPECLLRSTDFIFLCSKSVAVRWLYNINIVRQHHHECERKRRILYKDHTWDKYYLQGLTLLLLAALFERGK